MSDDQKTFRDRLQTDFDERYPKLLEVIDKAMSATTTAWVNCPHCKKRSEVEVVDTKAALAAAEFIANQSHGRPGVAPEGADNEGIKLVRVTAYDGVGPDRCSSVYRPGCRTSLMASRMICRRVRVTNLMRTSKTSAT